MPLTVFRCLQGVGFSAAVAASSTAAADVLPMQRLGEGLGLCGARTSARHDGRPAAGAVPVSTDPPENLYWCFSAVAAIGLCIAFFCRYESNPQKLPRLRPIVCAGSGSAPNGRSLRQPAKPRSRRKGRNSDGSAREGKAPPSAG